MKVAIVTGGFFAAFSSKSGAVETLVQYLIEENERAHKLDLVVFSCADSESEKKTRSLLNTRFEYFQVPMLIRIADKIIYCIAKNVLHRNKHLSYRYVLQRMLFIYNTGRALAAESFDRIVFENSPSLLLALHISNNKKIYMNKYIYHMHNIIPSFFGCEDDMLACRKVLGVSNYALNELQKFSGGKFDDARLAVLRNNVDERVFTGKISLARDRELRRRYGIPNDAKIILFGGRLTPEKGALEMVRAFSKLVDMNVYLLIMGSYYYGSKMRSDYEQHVEQAAREYSDRIVFTGFIPHSEMPDYYALADVVCAPSVGSDSAPLAVIEPLTAGCPVVTTQIGGIPEYATDGVDSVVLPIGGELEDSLAAAIRGILTESIRLHRKESTFWNISSFYENFVRLVSE